MRIIYAVIFLVCFNFLHAQDLTIQETVDYINKKLMENPCSDKYLTYLYSINLDNSGKLTITETEKSENTPDKIYSSSFLISNLTVTSDCFGNNFSRNCLPNNISYYGLDKYDISVFANPLVFFCNNNEKCITNKIIQSDNKNDYDYLSCFTTIHVTKLTRESLCNAFVYLFRSVLSDPSYTFIDETKKDDPFATRTIEINNTYINKIPLSKEGNIYKIKVVLNDNSNMPFDFIFDTGADNLFVTSDIFMVFYKAGLIKNSDINNFSKYTIADSSIITGLSFVLRKVQIGNYILNNVSASVSNKCLLGGSLLNQFGKYSVDTKSNQLIIEK
jgi:hypothetical protein